MLKGQRTRLFGALIAVLGVIETQADVIPADWRGWVLMATGIGVIVLRQITTTAPGAKA